MQGQGDKMKGYVKGKFFDSRYKVSTGKQSQGLNFFQMILKFLATDSIEITRESHLPMSLFHYKFKKVRQEDFTKVKKEFQETFWSIIWCCYRKDFKPLLQHDKDAL